MRVRGRVERFRDELQVKLEVIVRADEQEADPASFLPVAYRDVEELDGFLEHLASEVYAPDLKALLENVLDDRALREQIRLAPCTLVPSGPGRLAHHAYLGGLLEHTVAVTTMVTELCVLHPRLDRDLLLCAAIVHDLGKTREFTYGADIALSEQGRMLGHIQLGLRLLDGYMPGGISAERRLALEHCVITHHGQRAAARTALRLGRGAGAVPAQRARRVGEGRPRARAAVGGRRGAFGAPARRCGGYALYSHGPTLSLFACPQGEVPPVSATVTPEPDAAAPIPAARADTPGLPRPSPGARSCSLARPARGLPAANPLVRRRRPPSRPP